MSRVFLHALLLSVFVCASAQAHHAGHGASASSASRVLVYQGTSTKPSSRAFFSYEAAQLDNDVGQTHTFLLGGELSLTNRISVTGMVPVEHIAHNFRSSATGLGDVSLQGKYLFWNGSKSFGYATSLWSFPTGDEGDALGRGAVGQQVDVFGGLNLGAWTLFGSAGTSFGYESEPEPLILLSTGVVTPRVLNERLYASFTVSSQIFLDSTVFQNGSAKVYAEPQIHYYLDGGDRWLLSVGGRVSAIDELDIKPGVAVTGADNILLSDVLYSGSLTVNYQF